MEVVENMKMKIYAFIFYFLFFGFCGQYCTSELKVPQKKLEPSQPRSGDKNIINVGVIVDMGSWEGKVVSSCAKMAILDFYDLNSQYKTRIVLHVRDSRGDSLQSIAAALDLLENVEVHAIIVPIITNKDLFLAMLGNKANVPVLSFSSISSLDQHPYFFQVSEDETAQFLGIASMIEEFKWKSCVILYEDTVDARQIQSYIYDILQENHVDVAYQTAICPRAIDDEITSKLQKLLKMKNSIIIVHMSPSLTSQVFANAKRLGMMSKGFAWIVTSKTMNILNSLDSLDYESMQGAVGIKSYIPPSSRLQNFTLRWRKKFYLTESYMQIKEMNVFGLWAYDAVWALAEAIERVSITLYPNLVQDNLMDLAHFRVSKSYPVLTSKIASSNFIGLSGEFQLVNRKLVHETYEMVNVIGKGERRVGFWTSSFGLSKEINPPNKSSSNCTLETIIWPGISITTPARSLFQISEKILRIGIPEITFHNFVIEKYDQRRNSTTYDGFSIDVFHTAVERLPQPMPYEFIMYKGSYDDLITQVYQKTYDAAVGDITITSNRSQYVDFTLPYTDLGVGIVAKLDVKDPWFFLRPLNLDLWIMSALLFVVTGFVVWLIEHRINEEFQGPPAQQIGIVLWFAASTLVYAHRENLKSNLSKFVVAIWLFVVLILTSSYTANLSSLLTVKQIRLTRDDYVGFQSGNSVFQGRTVSNLNFGEDNHKRYLSPGDYHEALTRGSKNGGVAAIVDEMPYIKSFLGSYPNDYTMINSIMTTNGFGFAFQKGSPLVHEISRAIAELREEGKLLEMEKKWFRSQSSTILPETKLLDPNTLGIDSFSGLFLVSGISKAIAILLFIVFLIYERFSIKYYIYQALVISKLMSTLRHLFQIVTNAIDGLLNVR